MCFPIFIDVYDLNRSQIRSVNASEIKSIRTSRDEITYLNMGTEYWYEVRETREEVLTLISQAIAKLA